MVTFDGHGLKAHDAFAQTLATLSRATEFEGISEKTINEA